ncbi:MAG TPA: aspartyl protease family protein [Steroidobacteraceae bacterium]|nr:aspartyl protease family protein [Steroidobacteraceae bacterium]
MTSTAGAAEQCQLVQLPPIPVTMLGWRPTVSAELDGHPTRLLVDTGAFFDALSPAETTEFKLPLSSAPHGMRIEGGLGNLIPKMATVKDLRIGPLSFPGNAKFLVGANDIGWGIAGVLGENLYWVFDVEFDFANGVMRFFRPMHCGGRPLAYWANASGQSVSVIELEPRSRYSPHLLGTIEVNGSTINAIFDTGAPTSILSRSAAELVGVAPGRPGVKAVDASDGLWSAPIERIQLGDNETIEHTHILVQDSNFAFGPGVWMFIGADFFLSHRVYLATSQSKLYFTYNGGPVFDLDPARAAQNQTRAAANTAPSHATAQSPSSTDSAKSAADLTAGTPADAAGFMRRGLAYADRLQFQQAIADLTQACGLAPKDAVYRYERGVVYWRDGRPDLALQDFDAAIKLNPNDYAARLWRGEARLFDQTGRKPDPQPDTEPRIDWSSIDRPAAEEARQSKVAAAGPKVDSEIQSDLDAVDRLAPAEADLRLTLGRVYEDVGQYAPAIHQYDFWIRNHPKDDRLAMALTWRCGSNAQAGADLGQALKDCNRAYDLMGVSWWSSRSRWPASWIASLLSTRSVVELRQGALERAIADDEAAIKLVSRDAYAFYARGLAELRKSASSRGQADLSAARKLQPDIDERYSRMGLAP